MILWFLLLLACCVTISFGILLYMHRVFLLAFRRNDFEVSLHFYQSSNYYVIHPLSFFYLFICFSPTPTPSLSLSLSLSSLFLSPLYPSSLHLPISNFPLPFSVYLSLSLLSITPMFFNYFLHFSLCDPLSLSLPSLFLNHAPEY